MDHRFLQFDSSGQPDDRVVYDSAGNLLKELINPRSAYQTNTDPVGAFGQWGVYTDKELTAGGATAGLPLMTYRFYDPYTMRFLSRDPLDYDAGLNLYTYAGGDPVNNADPEGLDSEPYPGPHRIPVMDARLHPVIQSERQWQWYRKEYARVHQEEEWNKYPHPMPVPEAGIAGAVEEEGASLLGRIGGFLKRWFSRDEPLYDRSLLPHVKEKAVMALRSNELLTNMTPEEREAAAQFYEWTARSRGLKGSEARLARLYNVERAKFLRGQIPRLTHPLRAWEKEKRL